MVGDALHDVQSGSAAGAKTCLLRNEWNTNARDEADFVIDYLSEIEGIVRNHSK